MINILDRKLLLWISKNRLLFATLILLSGNVYQYIDRKDLEATTNTEKKDLNQKIEVLNAEAVSYERKRSEELELLLRTLTPPNTNPDNGKH